MRRALFFAVAASLSCGGGNSALPMSTPPPATYFTAERTDTTFVTADHFLASIEMQISGEPFAQLLGRNLAGYDRFNRTPDLYFDPATGRPTIDPLGYSMAIESYEYSKQPMNNTSFESGAGLALEFGPLLNPKQLAGDDGVQLLTNRIQQFALAANAGGAPGANFVVSPAPEDNPLNVLGWPGYWPAFAEFSSFDSSITPATHGYRLFCSFTAGYAGTVNGRQVIGDYECSYNSLNLPNRDGQVSKILIPDALGYATWKQGLWTINYWQTLHDVAGNGITAVADADIPQVGVHGNAVVGQFPDPNDPTGQAMIDGSPGVYLGDIVIEGFQGQTMIEEMDNKAAFLTRVLLTGDGATFSGFATTKQALDYDYTSPLRWWPAQTLVTEASTPPPNGNSWRYFPQPLRYSLADAASHLRGLSALAGGFATFYALTDFNNPDVGGQPSSRATFDGDPFAADDQIADGEESPHDRALAVIKVALVDIDRLHWDDAHHVLVDTAMVGPGGAVQRGSIVSAVDAAWAIIGMRQALRSVGSTLTLYSNDTPDTHGAPTALDGVKLDGAAAPLPARTLALIAAEADFLADKLTDDNGAVANSYDVAADARDLTPTRIESEAAVIRALLDAYLATSNERYRQAAMRIYADLERRFWMSDVRAFRTVVGESDRIVWTPLAHGTLQGALRQYWKLVARRPGNERVAAELLERVKRQNKLVLNGWDDANGDDVVQYPAECTGAGLQMGERALTGELARVEDRGDRDHDCVVEISLAKRPAALAAELVLQRRPTTN
ncbi:MAG TPA: hypothetical protein VHB97_17415 [Polyangia bacterium]|nr:hypothetical protein [Polyangia bacterium]